MRARIGIVGTLLVVTGCFEDEASLGLREARVLHAYAAETVYHCPVPFWYEAGSSMVVYEGADLLLRAGNIAELAFYQSSGSGPDAIDWQADTLRVTGTYRRDGFTLELRFDEGYLRTAHAAADMIEGGRLTLAFDDGGPMEFVPAEQKPTGPAERCSP